MTLINIDVGPLALDRSHEHVMGHILFGATVVVCYVCANLSIVYDTTVIPGTINPSNQLRNAGWVDDGGAWACPECADRATIEELGENDEVYR